MLIFFTIFKYILQINSIFFGKFFCVINTVKQNQSISTALRRSEENLRLITDSVPALIGYFDHEEIYRYVNKGYADWFGATKEEVLGRSVHEVVGDEVYTDIG